MVLIAPKEGDIERMARAEAEKERLEFDDNSKKMLKQLGLDAKDIKTQLGKITGKF